MELIYKVDNTGSSTDLVKHSNFKEHYPGVHQNTTWADLKPFIKQAVREFLWPWVGKELYNDLAAKYQADDTLTAAQEETLELMQNANAYYAIYLAFPALNTQLTNLGAQQQSDSQGTSNAPSQWSYKNSRWNALLQADTNLDMLLAQLTEQVEDETAYYDLWKNSSAYSFGKSDFIHTVATLGEFVNMQNSIRTYRELIKYVKKAEYRYLAPVLGDEMYAELKTQTLAGTLTTANEALLPYVQAPAAEFGLHMSIPYLTLLVQSDGFKIVSQSDMMDSRKGMMTEAHQRAIESLRQESENNGMTRLASLKAFIYDNADDYPTFKNSSVYETYDPNPNIMESQDGKGAVFL